jgi:ubiquinol oxidase
MKLHHLLIMESLGGNSLWSDRFVGYHAALAYYWFLIVVYFFSPRIAYQFMELLKATQSTHMALLFARIGSASRSFRLPNVARSYYSTGDLYLFDDFQVSRAPGNTQTTLRIAFGRIRKSSARMKGNM